MANIQESAAEVLIPMRQNSDGESEWLVEQVYARGMNGSMHRLAAVAGIEGIQRQSWCSRPSEAPADWIAELLSKETVTPTKHKLVDGSFVRVLRGECASLCGHVARRSGDKLIVHIRLYTKTIRLHTHPDNVQVLAKVPQNQRVFFYHAWIFDK